MKMFGRFACTAVVSLCLACLWMTGSVAQPPPIDPVDDGETIIEEGSEGLTTIAVAYGAENYDGQTCTGPNINCAAGPSPDCDTGDCQAVTTLTIPTCEDNDAWLGTWHCYQNGMECQNGTCPDGFMCFNTVAGACTSDWWWF